MDSGAASTIAFAHSRALSKSVSGPQTWLTSPSERPRRHPCACRSKAFRSRCGWGAVAAGGYCPSRARSLKYFWEEKLGVIGGEDHVTAQRQFKSATNGRAVNRRDHRFRTIMKLAESAKSPRAVISLKTFTFRRGLEVPSRRKKSFPAPVKMATRSSDPHRNRQRPRSSAGWFWRRLHSPWADRG